MIKKNIHFLRKFFFQGKTCLVRRFCQGVYPIGQAATIGVDFMIKNMEINGERIKVKFK